METSDILVLGREHARLGTDRAVRRQAERGELVRVAPGGYVPVARWNDADDDERHRLTIGAHAARDPNLQFSHDSAAALWRLPAYGGWPTRAHVLEPTSAGGRSSRYLVRHGGGHDPAGTERDGIRVTSLVRTVVDVAHSCEFPRAVGMIDAALAGSETHGREPVIRAELDASMNASRRPGAVRARRAIAFADGRSESLGESLSRVQFEALGLPRPLLQQRFVDEQGTIIPDFYFPEFDLAGEFDGAVKYGDGRRFGTTLSAREVLIAEKRREDRLRRLVSRVARWGWAEATDRRALAAILRAHGIRV